MKFTRTFFLVAALLLAAFSLLLYMSLRRANEESRVLQAQLDDIESLLAEQEDSTLHYLERLRYYRAKSQLDDRYFRQFSGPLSDSLLGAYRALTSFSEFEGLDSRRSEFHSRINDELFTLQNELEHLTESRIVALEEIRLLNAAKLELGQELIDSRQHLRNARDSVAANQKEVAALRSKLRDAVKLLEIPRNGNTIYYIGDRSNGGAEGYGFGIWSTGGMYKGDWKNNLRHGQGWYKWIDGEIYEGDFHEDKRQGSGKYIFKNGEYYTGEWLDNKRHGFGTIYSANGTIKYQGHWENDKLIKSTLTEQ